MRVLSVSAMCGDGSNDCSALKAANVGISLSEAEASVASPFTSKQANISCVPKIIREGRAALVTSFGVFKLMLCYSLTQFAAVILLYVIDSNLTSFEFLFIDIGLVLFFSSFFGNCAASKIIHNVPPMTSMLSFVPLTSLILFMACTVLFQVLAFLHIQTYDWFEPFVHKGGNVFDSYENYAVFCLSIFQYITMAVVFSKGEPYRRPIYTNKIFTFTLVVMTAVCVYITVYPSHLVIFFLELKLPPFMNARLAILGLAFANFLTCFLVECVFVDYLLKTKIKPAFDRKCKKSQKTYLKVLAEIEERSWPLDCINCDKKNSVIIENVSEVSRVNGYKGVANGSFRYDEGITKTSKL